MLLAKAGPVAVHNWAGRLPSVNGRKGREGRAWGNNPKTEMTAVDTELPADKVTRAVTGTV